MRTNKTALHDEEDSIAVFIIILDVAVVIGAVHNTQPEGPVLQKCALVHRSHVPKDNILQLNQILEKHLAP